MILKKALGRLLGLVLFCIVMLRAGLQDLGSAGKPKGCYVTLPPSYFFNWQIKMQIANSWAEETLGGVLDS